MTGLISERLKDPSNDLKALYYANKEDSVKNTPFILLVSAIVGELYSITNNHTIKSFEISLFHSNEQSLNIKVNNILINVKFNKHTLQIKNPLERLEYYFNTVMCDFYKAHFNDTKNTLIVEMK